MFLFLTQLDASSMGSGFPGCKAPSKTTPASDAEESAIKILVLPAEFRAPQTQRIDSLKGVRLTLSMANFEGYGIFIPEIKP